MEFTLVLTAFSMEESFANISAILLLFSSISAATKDTISVLGSFLQRKMVSCNKLEELDTEIGSCFPIQLVVLVSFISLDGSQIDSKSNTAKFLNSS